MLKRRARNVLLTANLLVGIPCLFILASTNPGMCRIDSLLHRGSINDSVDQQTPQPFPPRTKYSVSRNALHTRNRRPELRRRKLSGAQRCVSVRCPEDGRREGQTVTFEAVIEIGGVTDPRYSWSVTDGEGIPVPDNRLTDKTKPTITVLDTSGYGGKSLIGTVTVTGLPAECDNVASCIAPIVSRRSPAPVDTYGNIKFNDEKARLDNFAIQLQNDPSSRGYIVAYGTCAGEGQARADRAKGYLVNTRGIDVARVVTVDGGCRSELTVELWVVPAGATPPIASTTGEVKPCPDCKVGARPKGLTGTRHKRAPCRHKRR